MGFSHPLRDILVHLIFHTVTLPKHKTTIILNSSILSYIIQVILLGNSFQIFNFSITKVALQVKPSSILIK